VARARYTVTCRFETSLCPTTLEMDTVGGVIRRPRERQYSPTFWPVPSRLTVEQDRVLHALFETPTAAALSGVGALEWIVARNAVKERAFGFIPVLAHPIGGTNGDIQVHEAALMAQGDVSAALRTYLPEAHGADELVQCDDSAVRVHAIKRSHDGDGVTVRLFCEKPRSEPVRLWLNGHRVRTAFACDALERELHALTVEPEGCVVVPLSARLTSVRLGHSP
jgi:hypothetical protein